MVEPTPGTVFAGFTIERRLGAGGMGSVYLAAHPRIPRKVALKLLHRSLTDDDYARTLFEREADHAARLDHPNIVSVHDRGLEHDQMWISMQFVDGTDAATAIAQGRIAPEEAVRIVGEIAKALEYAHEHGVLHRDVKPANILLAHGSQGRPGRVLLTDFGIAKALAETGFRTRTGTLVASLHYAAPEQFAGATLDPRADVYSLGGTLFHLLTGRPPYPGESLPQLMHAHLNGPVPVPSRSAPGLSTAFDPVVARAMAKDPADRYPSCAALAAAAAAADNATRRFAEPAAIATTTVAARPDPAPPRKPGFDRRWLAAILAAVVLAVAAIVVVTQLAGSHDRPVEQSQGAAAPTTARSTTLQGVDGADYTVSGELLQKLESTNAAQRADLGPPLGAEKTNPDGHYQWFVGGVIIQKTGKEPHIVWGEIRNKWNELGGSQGELGYPTSDEIDVAGTKVSTFENGKITFESGVTTVTTR